MGFFDWLFGKKESEFIPAEKGLDDFAEGKIAFIDEQLEVLLNIYYESVEIVKTSKNIETIVSRIGVIVDTIEKISEVNTTSKVSENSRFKIFTRDVQNFDVEEIYKNAVERFIRAQIQEISKLKTEKGRKNRVKKIFAIIDKLEDLTDESKNRVKNFLLSELNLKGQFC